MGHVLSIRPLGGDSVSILSHTRRRSEGDPSVAGLVLPRRSPSCVGPVGLAGRTEESQRTGSGPVQPGPGSTIHSYVLASLCMMGLPALEAPENLESHNSSNSKTRHPGFPAPTRTARVLEGGALDREKLLPPLVTRITWFCPPATCKHLRVDWLVPASRGHCRASGSAVPRKPSRGGLIISQTSHPKRTRISSWIHFKCECIEKIQKRISK